MFTIVFLRYLIFIAAGVLLFQVLATYFPFRRQDRRKRDAWFSFATLTLSFVYLYLAAKYFLPHVRVAIHSASGGAAREFGQTVAQLPGWLVAVLLLFAADFAWYWLHRAHHTLAPLWHFHAFHHSPQHLDWLSGYRSTIPSIIVYTAGLTLVEPLFPLAMKWQVWAVFGIRTAMQHLSHSNVRFSWGPLSWLLTSPAQHFVHHSADTRFGNTNFGNVFIVWDRIFGTYTNPVDVPPDQPLGLSYPIARWRLLFGLPPARPSPVMLTEGEGALEQARS